MSRVAELVRRFEECSLPLCEFRHTEHLQVALWYVLHHPVPEATSRMRRGLQALLSHNGVANGYSEETTLRWMRAVAGYAVGVDSSAAVDELASGLAKAGLRA